ncbi:B-cell receptor-associated protein 31 [Patella vulgata]|uniref:B-cell receptor-associated protein 31 n=1 Tax=Patella vulgata TaxID=6465 RepID=UPI00217F2C75|nr:B-cell receptor-associated protein 31 [Patella vulgata]XP_050414277.1 B-cell receptor-associated protein 31 [Patella vulgata]
MSIQWTFIATVLYAQLAVVFLLLLPWIKPSRWQKIFRSGFLAKISTYGHIYFNVFILILLVLFADSVREVRKFSAPIDEVDLKHNPDAETKNLMRLFRAQRNFYIAGFALFLWFIIRRLVTLIANQALLQAQCEASQKQASSASQAAQRLLDDKENKVNKTKEDTADIEQQKELNKLKEELNETKEELRHAELNLKSMKKQSESTNVEYDRLLKEHATLQEKMESLESSGGKKDK